MGRLSVSCFEPHEQAAIEEALDEFLWELVSVRHDKHRFPEDVGTIGLLMVAPSVGWDVRLLLFDEYHETVFVMDDLVTPTGVDQTFKAEFPKTGGVHSVLLKDVKNVKAATLINILASRISQSVTLVSQGRYQMVPSEDSRGQGSGYWWRGAITREIGS